MNTDQAKNAMPEAVCSTGQLGPLPPMCNCIGDYTAKQVLDYAAAEVTRAVAAERERCAKLCETVIFTGNTFPRTQMEQLRMDIAAAILGPNVFSATSPEKLPHK